ncbi:MAG: sialidase family protein [Kiritimatiellales bacterium]
MKAKIENEKILAGDLGISTAPPGSPAGEPRPAEHDFVLYIPSDPEKGDETNQHVQVKSLGGDIFFANWTMSNLEGGDNQHIVVSRSEDGAKTWSKPVCVDGPDKDGHIASWGFSVVVPATGRIYLLYNKQQGFVDFHHQWTGQLWFRYSDDSGKTWSRPYKHLKIGRNDYSHPDPDADPNWIVFQPPIVTSKGDVLAGFTHVGTRALSAGGDWADAWTSECRFLRFDNILTENDPEKLTITTFPEGGHPGLRFPHPTNKKMSFMQEPAIAELPDGRLFCVMRTMSGFIAYSISDDHGATWQEPDFLRYSSGGEKIPNPVVPCPIYRISGDRYLLLFYNNSGEANQGRSVLDWCRNRRPAWFSIGRPCKGAQPLEFGKPVVFADNDRIPISRKQLTEIGTYPCVFEHKGKIHCFFSDRKHFVLGKILSEELLAQSQ